MGSDAEKRDAKSRGLLEVMRVRMRLAHMSLFTEKNYIRWVRQFIRFHRGRHPREMGAKEITMFLSYLAADRNVSAATQNQALNALADRTIPPPVSARRSEIISASGLLALL